MVENVSENTLNKNPEPSIECNDENYTNVVRSKINNVNKAIGNVH